MCDEVKIFYVFIKRVGASVFQNMIVDCKVGIECLFQFRGARRMVCGRKVTRWRKLDRATEIRGRLTKWTSGGQVHNQIHSLRRLRGSSLANSRSSYFDELRTVVSLVGS